MSEARIMSHQQHGASKRLVEAELQCKVVRGRICVQVAGPASDAIRSYLKPFVTLDGTGFYIFLRDIGIDVVGVTITAKE